MRPDVLVLNSDFTTAGYMDTYRSLIWNDKFAEVGDFDLELPVTAEALSLLQVERYCIQSNSDRTMIISSRYLRQDATAGNSLIVKGYSLENILKRRIVWGLITLQGNLQDAVERILNENVISPSNSARRIPGFTFKRSSDSRITSLTIDTQSTGDVVYALISDICKDNDLGFKVTLTAANQFQFELYLGADRSYSQEQNPYVVFSPKYDTLPNSQHIYSTDDWCNVALIGGEGEGSERRYQSVGTSEGLSRRELFVDAKDISSRIDNDNTMSDADYNSVMQQRGYLKLLDYTIDSSFEADIQTNTLFKYNRDFYMGDVVQVDNGLGTTGRFRVTELVQTYDAIGESIIPTFSGVNSEEED